MLLAKKFKTRMVKPKMKSPINILFEVARIVLLIPHSNTVTERLCYNFQLDNELLGMAKKAVVNYNKEHSN